MTGIQIRKEDIKPSLLADDMFLYIEYPEDTTKKLLKGWRIQNEHKDAGVPGGLSQLSFWLRLRPWSCGLRFKPTIGLCADSSEPGACFGFSLSLSLSAPPLSTLCLFSLYYKAVIIKRVWYWHKNRHTDQWNRIETPEVDSQMYGQLSTDKAGKSIQWKKKKTVSFFWENWTATCRRMELDHFLTPYTQINSKWMKDLTVRQETIKTLEEKAGKKPLWPPLQQFLTWHIPKGKGMESKNKLLGPRQDKKLLHCTGINQQNQRATDRMGEDICKWHIG